MKFSLRAFSEVDQFSEFDKKYAHSPDEYKRYIKYLPNLDSFKQVLIDKSKQELDRALLVEVLLDQHKELESSSSSIDNINALIDPQTFTLTTAHQANLFTGPLYFIYKIISTINLSEKLSEDLGQKIIPVFVLGSEDHDLEELNHIQFFNQEIQWDTAQKGPLGRMNTEGIKEIIEAIAPRIENTPFGPELLTHLKNAYECENYDIATRRFINALFKDHGLVILSMDDPRLKKKFIPIFELELKEQISHKIVSKTNEQIEADGLKVQAVPRAINLFYLDNGVRERIIFENGSYSAINTDLKWTQDQLIEFLNNSPEYFSPNVILRPLYQDCILPNLAYIGGGGELSYWTQLKPLFDYFKVNFPVLIRRNSVGLIKEKDITQLEKLGLSLTDLFQHEHKLIDQIVNSKSTIALNVDQEKSELLKIYDQLGEKAKQLDPTLKGSIESEKTKQLKSLDMILGKMKKAEKRKNETAINKASKIQSKLFPSNSLQERKQNVLEYYAFYGPKFIQDLKQELDPLEKKMYLFEL